MPDVLIHFVLECIGGATCQCATHYCRHRWLSLVVWLCFGLASSWLTVQLVG